MPTVLLVDDSPLDRELAGRILAEDASLSVESAEDGRAALARLAAGGIDLVVTDLQMPELDGLQLVTAMRVEDPGVPVILMTAVGSEAIAMEALENGAAGYVPKRDLNQWLLPTAKDALALRQTERAYEALIACFHATRFELSLKNDPRLVDPLVDYIQQIVSGVRLTDATGGYQIGVALREALNNALFRGNLEITSEQMQEERERLVRGQPSLIEERRGVPPYRDRRVSVDVQITREELRCRISDEGSGFDVSALPGADDPRNAFEPARGRGLVLMRAFMDEVSYNDAGNIVTLVKRRQSTTG